MKRTLILIAIALLATFSSCGGIRKVSVGKVQYQGVQLKSFTSATLNVGLEVNNPTKKTIYITSLEGQICKDQNAIAEFNLEKEIAIEPGHTGFVTIPLDTRIVSLAALYDLPIDQLLNKGFSLDFNDKDKEALNSILKDLTMPTKVSVEFGGMHKTKRIANLLEYLH